MAKGKTKAKKSTEDRLVEIELYICLQKRKLVKKDCRGDRLMIAIEKLEKRLTGITDKVADHSVLLAQYSDSDATKVYSRIAAVCQRITNIEVGRIVPLEKIITPKDGLTAVIKKQLMTALGGVASEDHTHPNKSKKDPDIKKIKNRLDLLELRTEKKGFLAYFFKGKM